MKIIPFNVIVLLDSVFFSLKKKSFFLEETRKFKMFHAIIMFFSLDNLKENSPDPTTNSEFKNPNFR